VILLLPVFAFRISFDQIAKMNFNDLKISYYSILKTNRLSLRDDLAKSIEMVENRNRLLVLNIKKLSAIIQSMEKDLSNKIESQRVLKTFDDFWDAYTKKNKLYLKNFSLDTSKGIYSFAFYEISDENDFNSKEVLSKFAENLNVYPDFSKSDKAPRNFGGFMAMFQEVNLSKSKLAEPSKKRK